MGLSDYDKKVLEQLEKDLLDGDDALARKLGAKKPVNAASKLIAGALVALIGMSLVVFAAVSQLVFFGIIGFVVALAGILVASANPVSKSKTGSKQAKPKAARGSFFENRWDNRKNG